MDERKLAKEVGAAIAFRRRKEGLTQAQVDEALGVEKETVSRLENGLISPTLARLQQLAELLDCPAGDLFRTPSTQDQAQTIAELLEPLSAEERELVVSIIGSVVKLCRSRRDGTGSS